MKRSSPKPTSAPVPIELAVHDGDKEKEAERRLREFVEAKFARMESVIEELKKITKSIPSPTPTVPAPRQEPKEVPPKKSIYGRRVRLNTDLTRYHRSLVAGTEGITREGGGSCVRGSDNFVSVRFPNTTLDILWRSIDFVD